MTTEAYLQKNIAALAGLKMLKAKGPDMSTGICANGVYYATKAGYALTAIQMVEVVADWSKDWPKYSGSPQYPVPDPAVTLDQRGVSREEVSDRAACIYNESYGSGRWNDDEYGDLRRELLDFLIEVIEDFVETNRED